MRLLTGVRLGHMKNALVGVLLLYLYTTPTSSFFIRPGNMKNKIVGDVYIAIINHTRVHSSHDRSYPRVVVGFKQWPSVSSPDEHRTQNYNIGSKDERKK